jgi:DNA processing protein
MRSVLDANYPANLRGAFDAPPYVFVKGEYDESWARDAVAVVGTRGASADGLKRARKVARTLVEAGYMVLSGLARGIDRAAHEATLDAGGRTVAVMGTGIDRMYPAEHKQLAERIVASGGALISQFEPSATGARHTFPIRNATMSGLALATVVVEAGETSGAKVQALAGLKHGSGVFLLRSLYETQEWARELVDVGKYGMRAHLIDDDQQLMAALRSPHVEQEQLAFS